MHVFRKAIILCAGCVVLILAAPRAEAQVPAIDAPAIAQNVQKIKNVIDQVKQMKDMATQFSSMGGALGEMGQSMAGDLMSSFTGSFTSALEGFSPQLPSFMSGMSSNMDDVGALQDGIQDSLYPQGTDAAELSGVESREYVQRRQAVMRSSATQGYSLALYARNQAAQIEEATDQTTQAAESSTDLRGDMAANTGALVQIQQQLATTVMLTAALLELASATALAGDDVTPSTGD